MIHRKMIRMGPVGILFPLSSAELDPYGHRGQLKAKAAP